ncbi:MAG: isochorismate synthase [Flavobacteriaceae bacterium]|nr:isochorismate synthase [Flavobacteriaceae bacterium]
MSEFLNILYKVSKHYNNKVPFVIFSLPESKSVNVYLQNNVELYDTSAFGEDCFVFAPFDYQKKSCCIPLEKSDVFETDFVYESIKKKEIEIIEEDSEKEAYCDQIKKAIRVIKSRHATKIVLSRKRKLPLADFDLELLIHRILNLYPSAFRYVWYHPHTGLWCGASPEVLVQTEGVSFKTMALAGTRKYIENVEPKWTIKEIIEQKIVVDAISTSLQKVTSVVKISKTYNHQAASLVHLRTDINGILKKGKATLSTITSALHPTPAVCGTPQDYAKKYILENENYQREYYTGFLGPICAKDSCSNLFVNLRCMKIKNNKAHLFVGGGITIDSIPIKEWEETQHKLQTMLQVLTPMIY